MFQGDFQSGSEFSNGLLKKRKDFNEALHEDAAYMTMWTNLHWSFYLKRNIISISWLVHLHPSKESWFSFLCPYDCAVWWYSTHILLRNIAFDTTSIFHLSRRRVYSLRAKWNRERKKHSQNLIHFSYIQHHSQVESYEDTKKILWDEYYPQQRSM